MRQGRQRDVGRQVKTPGPPSLQHTGWYSSPPYYLIGSLQAGRPSTCVGGIKGLRGYILIGLTGPCTKKISKQIDKRKISCHPSSGFITEKHLKNTFPLHRVFELQKKDNRDNKNKKALNTMSLYIHQRQHRERGPENYLVQLYMK